MAHTVVLLTGREMPTTTAYCSCGWSGPARTYLEDAEIDAELAPAHRHVRPAFVTAVGSGPELVAAFESAGCREAATLRRRAWFGPDTA